MLQAMACHSLNPPMNAIHMRCMACTGSVVQGAQQVSICLTQVCRPVCRQACRHNFCWQSSGYHCLHAQYFQPGADDRSARTCTAGVHSFERKQQGPMAGQQHRASTTSSTGATAPSFIAPLPGQAHPLQTPERSPALLAVQHPKPTSIASASSTSPMISSAIHSFTRPKPPI